MSSSSATLENTGSSISQLHLSKIRTDGGTQPREEVSPDIASEYAEAMKAGATFPPVTVFYDGTEYWLADGFHRVVAAGYASRNEISAEIKQGTRREAVLFSTGANSTHGLRRTNADKRRAVETLLRDEEWSKWGDRAIARWTNTTHPFVAKVREEVGLTGNISSEERVYTNRHGGVSTMNTANIGKPQPVQNQDSYPNPPTTSLTPGGDGNEKEPAPDEESSLPNARSTRTTNKIDQPVAPVTNDSTATSPLGQATVTTSPGPTLQPEPEEEEVLSDNLVQATFGCAACKHSLTSMRNLTGFECSYLGETWPLEDRRKIGNRCSYWKCWNPELWERRLRAEGEEAALSVVDQEVKEFVQSAVPHMADKVIATLSANPYLTKRWEEIKRQAELLIKESVQ